MEVLVSLAIVGIVAALGAASFISFNTKEALETESGKLVSLLSEARTLTLSAKDESVFGVHFETEQSVLFRGSSYSAGSADNKIQAVQPDVKISSISLGGGGAEVVFNKRTGATAQSGTITLTSVRDESASTTVTVTGTGVTYSN